MITEVMAVDWTFRCMEAAKERGMTPAKWEGTASVLRVINSEYRVGSGITGGLPTLCGKPYHVQERQSIDRLKLLDVEGKTIAEYQHPNP